VTIHARTRTAGYSPPVYWAPIGRVRARLGIPVVANGDIWTVDDFRRCRDLTGCCHFMLGRGALCNPGLSHAVASELGITPAAPPADLVGLMRRLVYWTDALGHDHRGGVVRRLKQWLKTAQTHGGFRGFDRVKRAATVDELFAALAEPAPTMTGP
jgi:tRNA-dihydrouridine synthase C